MAGQGFTRFLVTHERAHYDDRLALKIAREHGSSKWPGVANAKLVFWNTGGKTPDGRPASEWEERGYRMFGVGHSRYDDHSPNGGKIIEDECCATLVAKDFGIRDDPSLKRLLDYALQCDLSAGQSPFNIASLIKTLNFYSGLSDEQISEMIDPIFDAVRKAGDVFFCEIDTHGRPQLKQIVRMWLSYNFGNGNFPNVEEAIDELLDVVELEDTEALAKQLSIEDDSKLKMIIQYATRVDNHPFGLSSLIRVLHMYSSMDVVGVVKFVFHILNSVCVEQKEFFDAVEEFGEKGSVEKFKTFSRGTLTLASIVSDNLQAHKAASKCSKADVVIVRRTNGHTAVLLKASLGLNLDQVAKVLQTEEANARGEMHPTLRPELSQTGVLVENWFLPGHMQQVLNGSGTADGVEATKLSPKKILECVKVGLSGVFNPRLFRDCQRGLCKTDKCPWYGYGLKQCYRVRQKGKGVVR